MEVVSQPKSKLLEEKKAALPSSSNIPEIIEEVTKDGDGKICCTRYLKGRLLGKGGFAKCFQASLMPCQTQYALKIVSKSTLAKSRARQKLQTEISIHRKMRHQFVVKFERYFEDTENAYMLLELCSNNSMSELLKRRRRVSELETRCYTSQLISSLKYLHGQLVIHRDLKLGNLFLDSKLRVKVGDFGLAARLCHVDEKRRTICGTPNYIAPEILEGKEGHSFEVDIWSAGVVMYTLLVGTPPFESKDVKSTYKRILNNSFAFPDHIVLSDDVKNLIRSILQSKPENRPSLDTIMKHNFFTSASTFVPDVLPESALYSTPQKQQVFNLNCSENQSQNANAKESAVPVSVDRQLTYGDENDPNGANRVAAANARVSSLLAKNCDLHLNSQSHANRDTVIKPFSYGNIAEAHLTHSLNRHHANSHSAAPPSSQPPPSIFPVSHVSKQSKPFVGFQILNDPTPSATSSQYSSKANSKEAREPIVSAVRMTTDTIRAPMSLTTTGLALTTTRSCAAVSARRSHTDSLSDKPSSNLKFDVTDTCTRNKKDSVSSTVRSATVFSSTLPITANSGLSQNRSNKSPTIWSRSSALQRQTNALAQTTSSASGCSDNHDLAKARKRTSSGMGGASLGQIEQELENVHLHNALVQNGLVSHHGREGTCSSKELSSKKRIDKTPNSRAKIAKHDTNDRKVSSSRAPYDDVEKQLSQNQWHEKGNNSMKRKSGEEDVGSSHTNSDSGRPKYVSPSDNIFSRRKPVKTPGTLEAMHEMLNLNYHAIIDGNDADGDDIGVNIILPVQCLKRSGDLTASPAPIWVVRYVDFTSKYGLGYLFNNNASGVCFNDSTKTVLSPNGEIFQYIERKRVSSSPNGSTFEQTIQTHSVHHYPVELQKKVTLLCHFRNYLLEQVKSDTEVDYDEDGCRGSEMDENLKRRIPIDSNAAKAASSKLKFGINSAVYHPQKHDIVDQAHDTKLSSSQGVVDLDSDNEEETAPEMVYLKKWVRTKHAILFRLSNRSVQVVFFDRSEILLSSEAKFITYVNKQGERADLSLHAIMQTGRKDIAKRLKYTKDIMHRLITIQHARP